jgi:hypothetical protein
VSLAKRRLLRCPFGRPGTCGARVRPPGLLGGRSARHALGGGSLDWRHGVGRLRRTTRTLAGSLGGVSNTRPIVLAGYGLLNTRRDTRLRCAPPTKRGRRTRAQNDCHKVANIVLASCREAGQNTATPIEPIHEVSRAGSRAHQGDLYRGGRSRPALTGATGAHA